MSNSPPLTQQTFDFDFDFDFKCCLQPQSYHGKFRDGDGEVNGAEFLSWFFKIGRRKYNRLIERARYDRERNKLIAEIEQNEKEDSMQAAASKALGEWYGGLSRSPCELNLARLIVTHRHS